MPDAAAIDSFTVRLHSKLLPSYCNAPNRQYDLEGFQEESIGNLNSYDAQWFLRALDSGLVTEQDGSFTCARSAAKETIFWEGSKTAVPRPITLWIEPIITLGALARLNEEFGWPAESLGAQSKTWAFDLVCYDKDTEREHVVCEVKKTKREIEKLIHYMQHYSGMEAMNEEPGNQTARNAYRKVQGIRQCWPELFWALGPNNDSHVFEVKRGRSSDIFSLISVPEASLNAP